MVLAAPHWYGQMLLFFSLKLKLILVNPNFFVGSVAWGMARDKIFQELYFQAVKCIHPTAVNILRAWFLDRAVSWRVRRSPRYPSVSETWMQLWARGKKCNGISDWGFVHTGGWKTALCEGDKCVVWQSSRCDGSLDENWGGPGESSTCFVRNT